MGHRLAPIAGMAGSVIVAITARESDDTDEIIFELGTGQRIVIAANARAGGDAELLVYEMDPD
jgi:hypothetical protein